MKNKTDKKEARPASTGVGVPGVSGFGASGLPLLVVAQLRNND